MQEDETSRKWNLYNNNSDNKQSSNEWMNEWIHVYSSESKCDKLDMHMDHINNINYKYGDDNNNIQCYSEITSVVSDRSNFQLKMAKHKSTFHTLPRKSRRRRG